MNNNDLNTRKRIFEILNKLSSGYDFKLTTENSESNDIFELVSILTNNNPYKMMRPIEIRLSEIIEGDPNTVAVYDYGQHTITYSLPFIEAIAQNKVNFMLLLDTIYHEQQHHNQDYYRQNPELIKNIDFKKATTDILDGDNFTDEEIEELHNFATQHHLLHLKLPTSKLRQLQFGGYYSKKCEVDARNTAFNDTTDTFKMMLEDELCSPKIKEFLTESYELYSKWQIQVKKINEKSMKKFERLDKKVKSILMSAIKTDKPLDTTTYNALLDGILDYISKHSTLKENLEIAGWALRHDYKYLLNRINLRNSLSSQKQDLSNFINDIVSQDLLTADNFSHICRLFSTFGQQTNDDAINYLVANLADRASADILLSNADIGFGITFYSKYITPEIIEVSLKNYLNKIEQTKTIPDYDKFLQTQKILNYALSNNDIKKETKSLLLSHLNRINKIGSDKKIKIIKKTEQEKEETLRF